MDEPDLEPVWGLVANVVDERFYGAEGATRCGTKHFVAGAKVFYHRAFWGMAAEQVTVTGHHRGSKKLVMDQAGLRDRPDKVEGDPPVGPA